MQALSLSPSSSLSKKQNTVSANICYVNPRHLTVTLFCIALVCRLCNHHKMRSRPLLLYDLQLCSQRLRPSFLRWHKEKCLFNSFHLHPPHLDQNEDRENTSCSRFEEGPILQGWSITWFCVPSVLVHFHFVLCNGWVSLLHHFCVCGVLAAQAGRCSFICLSMRQFFSFN